MHIVGWTRQKKGSAGLALILVLTVTGFAVAGPDGSDTSGAHAHAERSQEVQHDEHDGHDDAHEERDDHRGHGDHEEHDERVVMTSDMAARMGVETAMAGPGPVRVETRVFGRLSLPPDRTSEVRARFPGVVLEVDVSVGDDVIAGQRVALVESDDSLQRYEVRAPIAGRVLERFVNPGETAGASPLLRIVDSSTLWAELSIFPRQRQGVRPGQAVSIRHDARSTDGVIEHVLPNGAGHVPVTARVILRNDDLQWAPGELVEASIATDQSEVPVAVPWTALQTYEGRDVVFVLDGDVYAPRPVELGRRDARVVEIVRGLAAGERYVAVNSYLLKADLEKAGAAHAH